jgi:membrane protease YdiL (CAAX protease family)
MGVQTSRRPLYTFLVIVFVLSAVSYGLVFTAATDGDRTGGFALLQFSPAVAAIVTKLIYQRNLRGLGWKWGKTRYQIASVVLPLILGIVGFGLLWLLGLGGFYDASFMAEIQDGISNTIGLESVSPFFAILILIVVTGTIGLLLPGIFAFGEELGWRGFLVPELYKHVNFTKTAIISGLLWSAFHYPLVIFVVAPDLEVSVVFLLVSATIGGVALSTIMGWLRLKSGSVWTAVLFHASLNAYVQGFFDQITEQVSNLTDYFSGEFGVMMSLTAAVAAYLFWRKRDQLPPPELETPTHSKSTTSTP